MSIRRRLLINNVEIDGPYPDKMPEEAVSNGGFWLQASNSKFSKNVLIDVMHNDTYLAEKNISSSIVIYENAGIYYSLKFNNGITYADVKNLEHINGWYLYNITHTQSPAWMRWQIDLMKDSNYKEELYPVELNITATLIPHIIKAEGAGTSGDPIFLPMIKLLIQV